MIRIHHLVEALEGRSLSRGRLWRLLTGGGSESLQLKGVHALNLVGDEVDCPTSRITNDDGISALESTVSTHLFVALSTSGLILPGVIPTWSPLSFTDIRVYSDAASGSVIISMGEIPACVAACNYSPSALSTFTIRQLRTKP